MKLILNKHFNNNTQAGYLKKLSNYEGLCLNFRFLSCR